VTIIQDLQLARCWKGLRTTSEAELSHALERSKTCSLVGTTGGTLC